MEENKIIKIIESTKSKPLSFEEKDSLKNKIILSINNLDNVSSEEYFGYRFFHLFKTAYVLPLVLIFILSGGISYAAGGSLPGGLLYPVKVGVNEKIGSIFVSGDYNKGSRESDLVSKRIQEIQTLATQGFATRENIEIAQMQIVKHSKNSKGYINNLENEKEFENALWIQTKLESSLAANDKLLIGLSSQNEDIHSIALIAKEEFVKISNDKIALEKNIEAESENNILIIATLKLKVAKLALAELNKGTLEKKSTSTIQMTGLALEEELFSSRVADNNEVSVVMIEEQIRKGEELYNLNNFKEAIIYFENAYKMALDYGITLDTVMDVKIQNVLNVSQNNEMIKEGISESPEKIELPDQGIIMVPEKIKLNEDIHIEGIQQVKPIN